VPIAASLIRQAVPATKQSGTSGRPVRWCQHKTFNSQFCEGAGVNRSKTKDQASGKWRTILPALGVPPKLINGKHQPCPHCGGKDRFRFTDFHGTGGYICSQCGAGSGFDLLMKINGWDFRTAALQVEKIVASCAPDRKPRQFGEAEQRSAMNTLWQTAVPVSSEDAAGRYLWRRCRATSFPASLRFVPALRCTGSASAYPAMLAKVTTATGEPNNIHRTYLSVQGHKAPIEAPRRMMPGPIAKGGAVWLSEPQATLGVAEGIETALSASALTGIPCWAALNAAMLKDWQPPQMVTHVVIFADHDEKFTGQAAAFALASRLSNEGYGITTRVPEQVGLDWNDVHQLKLKAEGL
jgi:putative DNA primase/helicase